MDTLEQWELDAKEVKYEQQLKFGSVVIGDLAVYVLLLYSITLVQVYK